MTHVPDHDRGLSHDLPTLLSRRRLLGLFGGASALALAGCSDPAPSPTGSPTPASSSASSASASAAEIPEETAGPFPGNGSNGVNVLTAAGIVRSDITRSFGAANGVAAGVPLTVELTVLDVGNGATPLDGAAVYLWHCDREGRYSLYDDSVFRDGWSLQVATVTGDVTPGLTATLNVPV